jgi:predicted transcriptional regulator
MSNSTKSKFPGPLQLKLPRGTNVALDELASNLHRRKSEIVRQAIPRDRQSISCSLAANP